MSASGARRARWRVAARLARRQVRRTISSSILIAALIALPIAGMTAYSIVTWSMTATPEESATAALGRMQAWVQPAGVPGAGLWQSPLDPDWHGYPSEDDRMIEPEGEQPADPIAALPAGAEAIPVVETQVGAQTAGGLAVLRAWGGEVWDDRFEGRFALVDGRAPTASDEALVTPAGLDRFGIAIGDEIALDDPAGTFTVVGTMTATGVASDQTALFLPEGALAGATKWFLPDTVLTWADVQELNEQGFVAYSRTVVLDPPRPTRSDLWTTGEDITAAALLAMLTVAGLFAAYVVVMLAGAAFSVAARRQQRSLAVAASVGATGADLGRTIVLQGTALGLIGGAAGLAAGIGIAAVVLATTDDGSGTRYWGFHVPWLVLAGILVFSVVVGTASAAVPARTVARSDTLSALRGARRPQKPGASRPIWGSIILVVGVAITIASAAVTASVTAIPYDDLAWDSPIRTIPPFGIVIGPILVQIGILLSGRWLLWLVSLALSRLALPARLASRDAAANASRTVPAFAAIGATVFIAVFALSQVAMQIAQSNRDWYYQAPVGALSVEFYPSGDGASPVTADQADAGARAAATLLSDAGTTSTAVVQAQPEWAYLPSADDVPDAPWVMAVLPEENLLGPTTQGFSSNGSSRQNPISVIAADELSTALGAELSAAQLNAYRAGAALVADEVWVRDGSVDIATWTATEAYEGLVPNNIWQRTQGEPDIAAPQREDRLDAVVVDLPQQPTAIAVSPETAARLGMIVQPLRVVGALEEPLADDETDRLYAAAQMLDTPGVDLSVHYETGPSDDLFWMVPVLVGVAVLVLGASAVALGLARFERRPDDATLSAVGATPGFRRRIGFWQGLIIAGFGTVAGAAAGILPPIGFAIQSQGKLLIADMPWPALIAVAFVLPLLIAVVSWLIPPRAPDLTRRTVIA